MELNISSDLLYNDSIYDILQFFKNNSISAQIFKTGATIKYEKEYKIEHGLKIKFFDTSTETFKDVVWPFLKEKYKLTCAYVRYKDEYMGCILNWPSVFVKSNCNVCN